MTIYNYQKLSLLAIRRIAIVRAMLAYGIYSNDVLRVELRKQQALRDKCRRIVQRLVDVQSMHCA